MQLIPLLSQLLKLAIPMTVTRLGFLAFAITDVIVVGQMAEDELAFQAAGTGVLSPPMLIGIGFLYAVTVLTAQAFGEGDKIKAQRYFRLGMIYAFVLGLACFLLALFPHAILTALGFTPDVVEGAIPIFRIIAFSLVFQMLFTVPSDFLEAVNRPRMVMATIVIANILNVFANIWLVGGGFGVEAMGAVGSAWSTLIIRIISFAILITWLIYGPVGKFYNLNPKRLFVLEGLQQRAFLKIGLSSAAAHAVESSAFAAMLVMAGWISSDALSGFNIALTILATLFMVSLGLASGTSVLVGNAIGEGDMQKARIAGFLGLGFNTVVMLGLTIVFFIFADVITAGFTGAPNITAIVVPLVAISGLIMLVDGGQVVASLAVRATGDSWTPSALYTFAYGFVMIPLGYVFAIQMQLGTLGLYYAIGVASIVAVTIMTYRFHQLSSREIHAIS